jgi:HlyD family secretion protein
MTFRSPLRVVRGGPEGEAALAFEALPEAGRELLHAVAQGAEEGEAVSVSGVLGGEAVADSVDAAAPVPDPGTPPRPPEEGHPSPATPWRPPLRMVGYGLVGLLLAAWLANVAYERVWRVEVEAASLVAPTAKITSPWNGSVVEIKTGKGTRVAAGDPLFVVESPEIQAELEEAALDVAEAELRVTQLEAAREGLVARLDIQRRIVGRQVRSQAAQVSWLDTRLDLAAGQVERLRTLHHEGAVSLLEVEEGMAEQATLAGARELARALLSGAQGRLSAARLGYTLDGDQIIEGLPEIEAALGVALSEAQLQRDRLAAARRRAEITGTVRAPFDGRVSAVTQTAGTPVRQGAQVVAVERDDERLVEAWLTRDEAAWVRIGDTALIEVPGLGRTYEGTVRSVETNGEEGTQFAALGVEPRMQVSISIERVAGRPHSAEEAARELNEAESVGLPAIVSFRRSWR